jgi:hypothetical protein
LFLLLPFFVCWFTQASQRRIFQNLNQDYIKAFRGFLSSTARWRFFFYLQIGQLMLCQKINWFPCISKYGVILINSGFKAHHLNQKLFQTFFKYDPEQETC